MIRKNWQENSKGRTHLSFPWTFPYLIISYLFYHASSLSTESKSIRLKYHHVSTSKKGRVFISREKEKKAKIHSEKLPSGSFAIQTMKTGNTANMFKHR